MMRWRAGKRSIHPAGLSHSNSVGDGDVDGAGGDELVGEAGQQPFDRLLTTGKDDVEMFALGDARAVDGAAGDAVALDDRDPMEVPRQRLRREQASHAGSQHDGVVVDRR